MRTLRSSLAPIAFGVIVVLGVAVLMPGAGVRVHRHARGESGHVHLDDLLAPSGRPRHPASTIRCTTTTTPTHHPGEPRPMVPRPAATRRGSARSRFRP